MAQAIVRVRVVLVTCLLVALAIQWTEAYRDRSRIGPQPTHDEITADIIHDPVNGREPIINPDELKGRKGSRNKPFNYGSPFNHENDIVNRGKRSADLEVEASEEKELMENLRQFFQAREAKRVDRQRRQLSPQLL